MNLPIEQLRLCCLMIYLDRLQLDGVRLCTRIRIAYVVSDAINRAIEKRGMTDAMKIVAAVRRRIHSYVLLDIEMDRRDQAAKGVAQ